tara:strand:- start:69 stop:527 length:459 start_codon:yes stop_codon:yes gene_type:complete
MVSIDGLYALPTSGSEAASEGKFEARSLKIDVPPAAYNISVAVGLIVAIFSGTEVNESSCPRASMTVIGFSELTLVSSDSESEEHPGIEVIIARTVTINKITANNGFRLKRFDIFLIVFTFASLCSVNVSDFRSIHIFYNEVYAFAKISIDL